MCKKISDADLLMSRARFEHSKNEYETRQLQRWTEQGKAWALKESDYGLLRNVTEFDEGSDPDDTVIRPFLNWVDPDKWLTVEEYPWPVDCAENLCAFLGGAREGYELREGE
jgi:hypothetical protein